MLMSIKSENKFVCANIIPETRFLLLGCLVTHFLRWKKFLSQTVRKGGEGALGDGTIFSKNSLPQFSLHSHFEEQYKQQSCKVTHM